MRWNCPHCGIGLTLSDDKLTSTWSFARCARCRGHSLVRTGDLNMIRIDQVPRDQAVFGTEEQAEYTDRPIILPSTRKPPTLNASSNSPKVAARAPELGSLSLPPSSTMSGEHSLEISATPLPPHATDTVGPPEATLSREQEPSLTQGIGATAAGPALPVLPLPQTQPPASKLESGRKTIPSAVEITAATSAIESLAAVIAANAKLSIQSLEPKIQGEPPKPSLAESMIASRASLPSTAPSSSTAVTPPPFDPRRLLTPAPAAIELTGQYAPSYFRFIPLAIAICAVVAITSGLFLYRYGERLYHRAYEIPQEQDSSLEMPAPPNLESPKSVRDRIQESAMAPVRMTPTPPRVVSLEIQASKVLLRSGPGTQYRVLGSAETGTEYRISSSNQNWFQIRLKTGQLAWVRSDLVRITDADPTQK